jgi:hypothetical protein
MILSLEANLDSYSLIKFMGIVTMETARHIKTTRVLRKKILIPVDKTKVEVYICKPKRKVDLSDLNL